MPGRDNPPSTYVPPPPLHSINIHNTNNYISIYITLLYIYIGPVFLNVLMISYDYYSFLIQILRLFSNSTSTSTTSTSVSTRCTIYKYMIYFTIYSHPIPVSTISAKVFFLLIETCSWIG